jgi:hypothetical protein
LVECLPNKLKAEFLSSSFSNVLTNFFFLSVILMKMLEKSIWYY